MRFWPAELQTLLPAQADPSVCSSWQQHGASSSLGLCHWGPHGGEGAPLRHKLALGLGTPFDVSWLKGP